MVFNFCTLSDPMLYIPSFAKISQRLSELLTGHENIHKGEYIHKSVVNATSYGFWRSSYISLEYHKKRLRVYDLFHVTVRSQINESVVYFTVRYP